MWQHGYGDGCEVVFEGPWCEAGLALLACCSFACYLALVFYRRRKSTGWTCPKAMCFTENTGVVERSVWSGHVRNPNVFYRVFWVAERSVWIEPVRKPFVLQCLQGCLRIERVRKAMCFAVFSGMRREASGLDMSESQPLLFEYNLRHHQESAANLTQCLSASKLDISFLMLRIPESFISTSHSLRQLCFPL